MSKSAFPVSADGIRNVSRPAWLTLGVLACLAVAQPMMAQAMAMLSDPSPASDRKERSIFSVRGLKLLR